MKLISSSIRSVCDDKETGPNKIDKSNLKQHKSERNCFKK